MPTLCRARSPCCRGGLGTRGARHRDPACSWPCLPPPSLQCDAPCPACTASSLASDPWLLAIFHFTQNKRHITRLLAVSLWLILVNYKENELSKISLKAFHTIFHFSNLFFLSQSYCCSAYVFDGLSHLLYTCMHVCLHTYKPIPVEPKE